MKASPKDFDLLVLGDINPDMIVLGEHLNPSFGQVEMIVDSIRLEIGGSAAIVACGAARLGLKTALFGVVGDDALGHFILEAVAQRKVDVTSCLVSKNVSTGASAILARGTDRAILTAPGTIGLLQVDSTLHALLKRARHLHLGSYFLLGGMRDDLPPLFAMAHTLGVTTSLDCNWDPSGKWNGGLEALLTQTDILLLNAEEIRRLMNVSDEFEAAHALVARTSVARKASGSKSTLMVAVKRGSQGAALLSFRGLRVQEALPVDAVDTSGAGDSFDAGFLYGWLRHKVLAECLRWGVVCGSLSTRDVGGTPAQPTAYEAKEYLPALGPAVDWESPPGRGR